jgi:uncharacterized membrane protein
MNKSLQKDLDNLVKSNILTPDLAEKIAQYYRDKETEPNSRFNIVLGILGALLVGFGMVLLVAHNWDEMSRPIQTLFAFLPLAAGQGLCLFTLRIKRRNTAWRESSAVILFFAVASCMALVSQIYHIPGALDGFLFTWLLLTAPLIYIMRSSVVSLLVISVVTWYAALVGYQNMFGGRYSGIPYLYPAILMFILPHYYQYLKVNRTSNFFHLHNWFIVISSTIVLGAFGGKSDDLFHWIFIGYFSLFSIYYLVGRSVHFRDNRLFANPFLISGVLGSLLILLFWSYEALWKELGESPPLQDKDIFRSLFFYLSVALVLLHAYLMIRWKRSENELFDPMHFSLYVFTLSVLLLSRLPEAGLIIMNAWILWVAIFFIRKGASKDHLGILNSGLLIIASLALLRFFDDGISFVWRGLFFLATGIGFFLANYLLLRKRKSLALKSQI